MNEYNKAETNSQIHRENKLATAVTTEEREGERRREGY